MHSVIEIGNFCDAQQSLSRRRKTSTLPYEKNVLQRNVS